MTDEVMSDADTCPHCQVDLRGEPIPEERRYLYGEHTHFSKRIMVEVRGAYDGGLFFSCPECGGLWHRWPEDHPLRAVAERFMSVPPGYEVVPV